MTHDGNKFAEHIIDKFDLSAREKFNELLENLDENHSVHIADYLYYNFNELPKKKKEWLLIRLSKDTNDEVRSKVMDIVGLHFTSLSKNVREKLIISDVPSVNFRKLVG